MGSLKSPPKGWSWCRELPSGNAEELAGIVAALVSLSVACRIEIRETGGFLIEIPHSEIEKLPRDLGVPYLPTKPGGLEGYSLWKA